MAEAAFTEQVATGDLKDRIHYVRLEVEKVRTEITGMETRMLDHVDRRLDGMDDKIAGMGRRLDGMDGPYSRSEENIDRLRDEMAAFHRSFQSWLALGFSLMAVMMFFVAVMP